MSELTAAEWEQAAGANATHWTVGVPGRRMTAYAEPAAAVAAVEDAPLEAGVFQWEGRHGHQVPEPQLEAWRQAWADATEAWVVPAEPAAEIEAEAG